jgi:hypothetical protein
MEKSESVAKLATALVAFQADMENVTKDGTNPFFKSAYATLENIISTAKPHLKKHGLAFAQFPTFEGLTTVLLHTSGEYIAVDAKVVIKDATPQGQGSAITYMRRYALSAALGIATEDDDDGNEASKPSQTRHAAPGATKTPPTKSEATLRLEANKDRLKTLLKYLGTTDFTVAGVKAAVLKWTGEDYDIERIDHINNTLAAKVEAKETAREQ